MSGRSCAAIAGGLLLAVALVWQSALSVPFHFDDYAVIVDNPAVHGLSAWWASMPGIRPLLTHVGRSFVTSVTLQVGANQRLRCQSWFDINWQTLFAPAASAG